MKTRNIFLLKYVFALIILFASSWLIIQNHKLFEILKEKPSDIVVTNIGATNATVYWKNNEGVFSILSYKEKEKNMPYISVSGSDLYKNIKEDNYIYKASLSQLQPNTIYSFRIQSPKQTWEHDFEFSTEEYGTKVELPDIKTGSTEKGNFLLIDNKGKKFMVYSSSHGTWALDLKGSDYTVTEYAQFIPSEILREELKASFFGIISPAYAESGANCKTNISITNTQYLPTKSQTQSLLDRLIGGCKGHYAQECYSDVYCQSIEAGVNPALPITLWVHESAGSMYAKYANVQDFGINGANIPSRDFTRQLRQLLDVQMADDYISGYCTDKGITEEERWATKYARGYCTDENIAHGKAYITEIREYYNWLTRGTLPSWPWNVSKSSSACDRSKQVTNGVYRDCQGNPTGTNPQPPENEDKYDGLGRLILYSKDGKTCNYSKGCVCIQNNGDRFPLNNGDRCRATTAPAPKEYDEQGRLILFSEDQKICDYSKGCVCIQNNGRKDSLEQGQRCRGTFSPDPDPNPDPDPTPDPGVTCTGPDNKPGKEDILVGQTCKDVGGCECFKGTIKTGNYLKDIACGLVCTDQAPDPDPDPTPDPDPDPTPDPGVTCTGPDNKPGKEDILVGQTCKDVGGCECFKGSIKTENYFKDVKCGYVCTEENPTPEDKTILEVTDKDLYCRNSKGCICYWNNKTVQKDAENGQTCTTDQQVIKTESICCYSNNSLSMKMPYDCSGVIRSDISKENCRLESTKYEIREGISFISPLEVIDLENPLIPKSAYDLINISDKRVIAVGEYQGGQWVSIVKYENGAINGNDFQLKSGKSYMVSSLHDTEFPVNGYRVNPSNILETAGWNLIPSFIFDGKGTYSVDILKNLEFNKIKQIGQWQKEKGLFDYTFKDESNYIFGNPLKISQEEGIFIKVIK